jgi:hypothetical protein
MRRLDRRAWSQFLALARPYWVCERKWTPWGLAGCVNGRLTRPMIRE